MDSVDIIGLSGKARSGKDYLAKNVLVNEFHCIPVSLADWFKIEGVIFHSLSREEVFGTERLTQESRRWMQNRGTEWGREEHGEDIWCRALELQIHSMANTGASRFVITDVRFPNEVEWIQGLGGEVYRIEGRGGAHSSDARNHQSETALDGYDGFDGFIDNSEDREEDAVKDLRQYAEQIFQS